MTEDDTISEDHILQIWADPEGGTVVDVFHPTGCNEGCPVLHWVGESYEETIRGLGLGTHRVEMWAYGPRWLGATHIDGDAGIRVSCGYAF